MRHRGRLAPDRRRRIRHLTEEEMSVFARELVRHGKVDTFHNILRKTLRAAQDQMLDALARRDERPAEPPHRSGRRARPKPGKNLVDPILHFLGHSVRAVPTAWAVLRCHRQHALGLIHVFVLTPPVSRGLFMRPSGDDGGADWAAAWEVCMLPLAIQAMADWPHAIPTVAADLQALGGPWPPPGFPALPAKLNAWRPPQPPAFLHPGQDKVVKTLAWAVAITAITQPQVLQRLRVCGYDGCAVRLHDCGRPSPYFIDRSPAGTTKYCCDGHRAMEHRTSRRSRKVTPSRTRKIARRSVTS
jgi:hypothetical protein